MCHADQNSQQGKLAKNLPSKKNEFIDYSDELIPLLRPLDGCHLVLRFSCDFPWQENEETQYSLGLDLADWST